MKYIPGEIEQQLYWGIEEALSQYRYTTVLFNWPDEYAAMQIAAVAITSNA